MLHYGTVIMSSMWVGMDTIEIFFEYTHILALVFCFLYGLCACVLVYCRECLIPSHYVRFIMHCSCILFIIFILDVLGVLCILGLF